MIELQSDHAPFTSIHMQVNVGDRKYSCEDVLSFVEYIW